MWCQLSGTLCTATVPPMPAWSLLSWCTPLCRGVCTSLRAEQQGMGGVASGTPQIFDRHATPAHKANHYVKCRLHFDKSAVCQTHLDANVQLALLSASRLHEYSERMLVVRAASALRAYEHQAHCRQLKQAHRDRAAHLQADDDPLLVRPVAAQAESEPAEGLGRKVGRPPAPDTPGAGCCAPAAPPHGVQQRPGSQQQAVATLDLCRNTNTGTVVLDTARPPFLSPRPQAFKLAAAHAVELYKNHRHTVPQGEVVDRLLDRLEDVRRGFPVAAVVGGAAAAAAARLTGGRAGVARLLHVDDSPGMLARAARLQQVSGGAAAMGSLRSGCAAPHAAVASSATGVELADDIAWVEPALKTCKRCCNALVAEHALQQAALHE